MRFSPGAFDVPKHEYSEGKVVCGQNLEEGYQEVNSIIRVPAQCVKVHLVSPSRRKKQKQRAVKTNSTVTSVFVRDLVQ